MESRSLIVLSSTYHPFLPHKVHFARCNEGKKNPVPLFCGSRGPELARSFREIEHTFEKHLSGLRAIQRSILDVKASSWHDEYNKFKAGVKDLEVMVQNVINSGFDVISTVQEGVELLEVFAHLTTREVSLNCLGVL